MTQSVRCGGHATLLFAVEPQPLDRMNQGSIGIGACFDAGVDVHVLGDEPLNHHVFVIDGIEDCLKEAVEKVATRALFHAGSNPMHLGIRFTLPFSRGFGMSAAVAAAVALIVQPAEHKSAIAIAHLVDRELSGGLGDAAGLAVGGIERRSSIGSLWHLDGTPGAGVASSFPVDAPVLLIWGEEQEYTADWINDEERASMIRSAGRASLEMIEPNKWSPEVWPSIIYASVNFLSNSGFHNLQGLMNVLDHAQELVLRNGMGEQVVVLPCYIGASVLIVPRYLDSENVDLSPLMTSEISGRCLLTRISQNPLRVVS